MLLTVALCHFSLVVEAQEDIPKKNKKFFVKAERYYNQFAYFDAIDMYKRYLEVNNGHRFSMLRISDSYYKIKDYPMTRVWYDSVLQKGDLPDIHKYQYADVMMNHGLYEKARIWLEKYLVDDPDNKRAKDKLEGLRDIHQFYKDSSLYEVNNLTINSKYSDFSASYYDSGFVFVSGREEVKKKKYTDQMVKAAFLDLYYTKQFGDSLGMPIRLSDNINSKFHEGPVAFYQSDSQLIFTRSNYIKKSKRKKEGNTVNFHLFHSSKDEEGEWVKPKLISFYDKKNSVGHPALNSSGLEMYFASNVAGGYGGSDIYKTTWVDGQWTEPQNLGPEVNTVGNEMFPFLFQDSILYFASDGFMGLGGLDIVKTNLLNLGMVENLGYPVNSNKDDFGITLDTSGRQGFFSSNRSGGKGMDDIYKFNILTPVETAPVEQKKFIVEVYYTIQILALKNKELVDRAFLQDLNGVLKHDGKDGFHRYTFGEYKGADEAFDTLKKIRERGYSDAFIRRVENYIDLSKSSGINVDELYERLTRVQ